MATTYLTPGVYVQEVPTLPPSVAPVSTAIPAFLGYTATSPTNPPVPTLIASMVDFQQLFGDPQPTPFYAYLNDNKGFEDVEPKSDARRPNLLLYYALVLYFSNGGGPCYIVSVGSFADAQAASAKHFEDGLDALAKEDEPTLIVLPDVVCLEAMDGLNVYAKALSHCQTMGNRFAILDVVAFKAGNGQAQANLVQVFRNNNWTGGLEYGAAYYPELQTSLNFVYSEDLVQIRYKEFAVVWSGLRATYEGTEAKPSLSIGEDGTVIVPSFTIQGGTLTITIKDPANTKPQDVVDAWNTWKQLNDPAGFELGATPNSSLVSETTSPQAFSQVSGYRFATTPVLFSGTCKGTAKPKQLAVTDDLKKVQDSDPSSSFSIGDDGTLTIRIVSGSNPAAQDVASAWNAGKQTPINDPAGYDLALATNVEGTTAVQNGSQNLMLVSLTLADLKSGWSKAYNQVKAALADQRVNLPPSAAMAGVYATVDRQRGVWKAPANVSLASVVAPTVKITEADQEALNIDPTGGMSINAIRTFTGKGTLVWGARTLAGNDNEWRYINVRRLFVMVEEATRKASAFAVFESNDVVTWLKVRGMIEAYLHGLWEQGALAGARPQDAYFVNVGLGQTMTPQDILEGRMIVQVGLAAVRPAEFVVIQFSHKIQES